MDDQNDRKRETATPPLLYEVVPHDDKNATENSDNGKRKRKVHLLPILVLLAVIAAGFQIASILSKPVAGIMRFDDPTDENLPQEEIRMNLSVNGLHVGDLGLVVLNRDDEAILCMVPTSGVRDLQWLQEQGNVVGDGLEYAWGTVFSLYFQDGEAPQWYVLLDGCHTGLVAVAGEYDVDLAVSLMNDGGLSFEVISGNG